LAPFLFFNGNTFAEIGRRITYTIFADLPEPRRREAASFVAHYVAGVLDRESMVSAIDALWVSAQFRIGDRVRSFRGSLRGVIVRILDDGQVVVRSDASGAERNCLPEGLLPD
jgi:hypothetical protein